MRFCDLHPAVNLLWFAAVGAITMLYMNPFTSAVALAAACMLMHKLGGVKITVVLLPMMLLTAVINPLFSHEGATILAYFPSGNPLTLESVIYGVSAALMIGAALVLCMALGTVVTSDKLMWLAGRILPSAAMLITMTLRFIPRFTGQLKSAYRARCALVGEPRGRIGKLSLAASVMSNTVTRVLEGSLDTADSMKSRGWGLRPRTSYSRYRLESRDKNALCVITALTFYFICGITTGALELRFYPTVEFVEITPFCISFLAAHAILCFYPLFMEVYYGIYRD